jgi:hypothetical protein
MENGFTPPFIIFSILEVLQFRLFWLVSNNLTRNNTKIGVKNKKVLQKSFISMCILMSVEIVNTEYGKITIHITIQY